MCQASTSPLRYSYNIGLNRKWSWSLTSVMSPAPDSSSAVNTPPKPPPTIAIFGLAIAPRYERIYGSDIQNGSRAGRCGEPASEPNEAPADNFISLKPSSERDAGQ